MYNMLRLLALGGSSFSPPRTFWDRLRYDDTKTTLAKLFLNRHHRLRYDDTGTTLKKMIAFKYHLYFIGLKFKTRLGMCKYQTDRTRLIAWTIF